MFAYNVVGTIYLVMVQLKLMHKYGISLGVLLYAVASQGALRVHAQSTPNVTVDFNQKIATISPLAIGLAEALYPKNNTDFTSDSVMRDKLKKLKLGQVRLELKYKTSGDPSSAIVCGASHCGSGISVDNAVTAIKGIGAEPVLSVPGNTTDAVNMVKHFNKDKALGVKKFIFGQEPDAKKITADTYASSFNAAYDAMKQVDPTIKIGGPATAYYNSAFLQTFLTQSGSKVDFIDFHQYGPGGSSSKTEAQMLSEAANYESNVNSLRTMIQNTPASASRAGQIDIQIGEWNYLFDDINTRFYSHFATIWDAMAMGYMLKAGAQSMAYSSRGRDLGLLYEYKTSTNTPAYKINDTMPFYHGIGMYGGEGLFRPFGSAMVSATSQLADVAVFASDNPRNIVVINKNSTAAQQVTIHLNGVTSGTVDVWRKDGSQNSTFPPVNIQAATISNGNFSYTLPPYSITTFLVGGGGTTTSTPVQTPTATITTIPTTTSTTCPTTTRRAGDANCDNSIDLLDFEIFRSEFISFRAGTLNINTAKADFNNDKSIDLLDFEVFRTEYIKFRAGQ